MSSSAAATQAVKMSCEKRTNSMSWSEEVGSWWEMRRGRFVCMNVSVYMFSIVFQLTNLCARFSQNQGSSTCPSSFFHTYSLPLPSQTLT